MILKLSVLGLLVLLLLQISYFGIDNCSQCKFGEEKLSFPRLYDAFRQQCLTINDTIPDFSNISILEPFQIENP